MPAPQCETRPALWRTTTRAAFATRARINCQGGPSGALRHGFSAVAGGRTYPAAEGGWVRFGVGPGEDRIRDDLRTPVFPAGGPTERQPARARATARWRRDLRYSSATTDPVNSTGAPAAIGPSSRPTCCSAASFSWRAVGLRARPRRDQRILVPIRGAHELHRPQVATKQRSPCFEERPRGLLDPLVIARLHRDSVYGYLRHHPSWMRQRSNHWAVSVDAREGLTFSEHAEARLVERWSQGAAVSARAK
jgi:hypothetical protein